MFCTRTCCSRTGRDNYRHIKRGVQTECRIPHSRIHIATHVVKSFFVCHFAPRNALHHYYSHYASLHYSNYYFPNTCSVLRPLMLLFILHLLGVCTYLQRIRNAYQYFNFCSFHQALLANKDFNLSIQKHSIII